MTRLERLYKECLEAGAASWYITDNEEEAKDKNTNTMIYRHLVYLLIKVKVKPPTEIEMYGQALRTWSSYKLLPAPRGWKE